MRVEGDVAYVRLSQGLEAIIDASDAELIGAFNWFAMPRPHTNYAFANKEKANGKRCALLMHRLIMGESSNLFVDHINRNGLDNRRCNLRFATPQQNCANSTTRRDNKSGVKGVGWRKDRQKWRAQITVNGRSKSLGHYDTRDEAANAYKAAARKICPDFFRDF